MKDVIITIVLLDERCHNYDEVRRKTAVVIIMIMKLKERLS